ncbi:unnamed protein product [Lampetra planeri]
MLAARRHSHSRHCACIAESLRARFGRGCSGGSSSSALERADPGACTCALSLERWRKRGQLCSVVRGSLSLCEQQQSKQQQQQETEIANERCDVLAGNPTNSAALFVYKKKRYRLRVAVTDTDGPLRAARRAGYCMSFLGGMRRSPARYAALLSAASSAAYLAKARELRWAHSLDPMPALFINPLLNESLATPSGWGAESRCAHEGQLLPDEMRREVL